MDYRKFIGSYFANITAGIISKAYYIPQRSITDSASYGGNSGGPVIDKHSNVVGVLVAGYVEIVEVGNKQVYMPHESLGVIVNNNCILKFLKDYKFEV